MAEAQNPMIDRGFDACECRREIGREGRFRLWQLLFALLEGESQIIIRMHVSLKVY